MNKLKPIVMVLAAMLMLSVGIASAHNVQDVGVSNTARTLDEPTLFDVTPPGDVTNLVPSGIGTDSITWTWTNPNDEDFAGVIVTVNGGAEVEVLGEHGETSTYTATGLTPNTEYTINIRTFDNAPEIAEIELCTKVIDIGEPWGYCTEDATSNGGFKYTTSGTEMKIKSGAHDLVLPAGTEYSLIYYKDTDAAHVLPSTVPVNILATGTSDVENIIHFKVTVEMFDNIPAIDDINPRGKIWIVPTSEIKADGSLKWTGFGDGNTMRDYLFESDLDTSLTPPASMGGITFTYTGAP